MESKTPDYVRKARESNYKNKGTPKVVNLIKPDNTTSCSPPKGEPIGTCKTCGNKFENDFYPEKNAYSNFKICPSCRKKISDKKEKKLKEKEVSTVVLPFKPHPWQAQAFEDFKTHRFNVWSCGNRSGQIE